MHDVGEVGDQVEIVFDDEQGGAVRGEGPQHAGQRGHLGGVETCGGFVEQQDARAAGQGPRQFDPSEGSGRQPGGGQRTYGPVESEQPQGPCHGRRIGEASLLGADPHVLGHGQRGEDGQLLKGPRDTEPGPGVRGQPGDVAVAEQHLPARGRRVPARQWNRVLFPAPLGPRRR